jgi:hypothetical protein
MNIDFESDVEVFEDEDLEAIYWFNKLSPKKVREKEFKVKRNRPREIDYEV